jgi:hypothetical protein
MPLTVGGPLFGMGFEVISKQGYVVSFVPDSRNEERQAAGEPPIYYWLPKEVRMAQKPNGDYKFAFVFFTGDPPASGTAPSPEKLTTGGMFSFSTTAGLPPEVYREVQEELLARCRGKDTPYWGWRTPAAPQITFIPIVSNTTSLSTLSPNGNGEVPAPVPNRGPGPRQFEMVHHPRDVKLPPTVPVNASPRGGDLDQWYVNLSGQGSGAIVPDADNAYGGLIGSYPAAILWTSFHGGQSVVNVYQHMKIKVCSPVAHLILRGEASSIQTHFSAAAHAGGLFWAADIQAQFNDLRKRNVITAEVRVDRSIPGAEKLEEELNKRQDMVLGKFMEWAQKAIFDPAPFSEKPAEAHGGFLGFGGGGAFKFRQDRTNIKLEYDEKRVWVYTQDYAISGQMTGLHDVIKADPSAEKKYFTKVFMGDFGKTVCRSIKAVVNWPDPVRKWAGEPVAFLSAQVGYPVAAGGIGWSPPHLFQASDPPDSVFNTTTAMKQKSDVTNPPAGWEPDKTFVKRKIHFNEPPSDLENPFARIQVEKNEVDLDPGPNGTLTNEGVLEVRVDEVGRLAVGPIMLDRMLDPNEVIEVTFQADGKRSNGAERPPVKFSWKPADLDTERVWMIFTGDATYIPKYSYQVRVIQRGTSTQRGKQWFGPWVPGAGNGPLIATVPYIDDPGVTVVREVGDAATKPYPPPTSGGGNGAPPPTSGGRDLDLGGYRFGNGDKLYGNPPKGKPRGVGAALDDEDSRSIWTSPRVTESDE